MQAENDDDLHGGQRRKLRIMMAFTKIKGHQRSNVVNYVLWLPYLVKRTADVS